jgi:hypothetical protein
MQLLKSREEALVGKKAGGKGGKDGTGGGGGSRRYTSDESESMAAVQQLGAAFQKIQAATGIHVRALACPAAVRIRCRTVCVSTQTSLLTQCAGLRIACKADQGSVLLHMQTQTRALSQ